MNRIKRFRIRIRNWRMERIPEIERPGCQKCNRPMYWHRGKQDWACEPCDDYYWHLQQCWEEEYDVWDENW